MSHVYFIQDERNRVKIGVSTKFDQRFAAIQRGQAGDLCVIRLIDGGRATERWLHRRYAGQRITGEWFRLSADMLTVVPPDEVIQRSSTPKPKLRMTLTECVRSFDQSGAFSLGSAREVSAMLVGCFWEDDAEAFIAWVRERTGVAEPASPATLFPIEEQSSLPLNSTGEPE